MTVREIGQDVWSTGVSTHQQLLAEREQILATLTRCGAMLDFIHTECDLPMDECWYSGVRTPLEPCDYEDCEPCERWGLRLEIKMLTGK